MTHTNLPKHLPKPFLLPKQVLAMAASVHKDRESSPKAATVSN